MNNITINLQPPHDCGRIDFELSPENQVVNCSFGIFKKYILGQDFFSLCAPFFKELVAVWNNNITTTTELDKYLYWVKQQKLRPVQPNANNFPEPVVQPTSELISNDEIVLYLLFIYRFVFKHRVALALHWVVIDLPPGVGKTYAIEKFCSIINPNSRRPTVSVCISAPTARTAQLYTKTRAKTVHGNFMIKPGPLAVFVQETDTATRVLNSHTVFVFDEFSMYGVQLLMSLLTPLLNHQKMVIIIGDSCQMPPVMQTSLCWFQRPNNNYTMLLKSLPFINYIQPDPVNVVLQRIGNRNENFRKLLLTLRGCILRGMELSNRVVKSEKPAPALLSGDDVVKRSPAKKQKTDKEKYVYSFCYFIVIIVIIVIIVYFKGCRVWFWTLVR